MKSKVFISYPKVLKHASVIAVMIPMTMLLLICGLSSPSYGQDVPDTIAQFSDRTLAIMVRVQLSIDNNTPPNIGGLKITPKAEVLKIPKAELIHLTHLEANDYYVEELGLPLITDLTGLEHATNLRELDLDENEIRDLTPLSELTALEWLDLHENAIRDLTPLSELTRLEYLNLGNHNLRDITPLANLTALEELYLYDNDIRDITPLANLTALEELYLRGSAIRDLTPLAQLTELKVLRLGSNAISDLTPLSALTALEKLNLYGNAISDLTPLSALTALKWLGLSGNAISDLTPLSALTALKWLGLSDNAISDLTPLSALTALEYLYLGSIDRGSNDISDLTPLSALTELKELSLSWNAISDLTPLSALTALEYLYLGRNAISDLTPLSALTALEDLRLDHNDISDLTPLSELIALEKLRLTDNRISDLTPLLGLVNLKQLWLRNNPIDDWEIRDWDVIRQLKAQNLFFVTDVAIPSPTTTGTRATVSTKIHISPSPVVSPAVGEQLIFKLNIAAGEAVAGYQATVQFDETALRYVSSANGDYLPAGAFFVEPKVEGNLIKLNAASLAGESNGDGTLATLTFEVVKVKASTLTVSDVLLTNSSGEAFLPKVENAEITESTQLKEDVNGDGIVNIQDLVLVAGQLGQTGTNSADVNADGVVNIQDLVLVAGALGTSAAAPSLHLQALEILTATDVKQWLSQAQQSGLTDTTSQRGILFLQQLFVALTPKETALLPNYPNPFNPETWIPYHLSKEAEVTLTIHDVSGNEVRALTLGHQAAGVYESRGRAAYWDGRNAVGEPVASGLYFYTLTEGDFTATRKMLILK